MQNITTIILTYNEEIHLERCITNAKRFSKEIFVVDSFSTDKTVQIAKSMGAKVFQNKWENNYAKQFNWALDNLPIQTEWVFRLDGDEYLSEKLIHEIQQRVGDLPKNINGIIFPLNRFFLNTLIKRGIGKMNLLRMFKKGKAICENRWMDEHIQLLEGEAILFDHVFYDHNLNNLAWWTQKHNGYSIREAVDLLDIKYNLLSQNNPLPHGKINADAEEKRRKKMKYAQLPLFFRSFVYFVYRYIFLLGFTEGKEAFLWHFLQGLWYRTLVDAKIYEIEKACGTDKKKMLEYIELNYGLKLDGNK
jgi:glycosyltransferase involved in cell wall biosynthesis